MWLVKLLDWLNALWHTWHLYGFSPLWILLCTVRCPPCANRLLQTEHSNSFSPEWIRLCVVKFEHSRKHFPHSLHLYGFTPLWILPCTARVPACVNRLPQTEHSNGFSPEWIRMCVVKEHCYGNTFHIHCTCVSCRENTYALSSSCNYYNTSHTEDTNMISVQCAFEYGTTDTIL